MPPGYTDDAVFRSAHTSSNFLASTLPLFVSFMVGARHAALTAVQYFFGLGSFLRVLNIAS